MINFGSNFIKMKKILFALSLFLTTQSYTVFCQEGSEDKDAFFIKNLFSRALNQDVSYNWLYHLSENIGGRLAGSAQSDQAVNYTKSMLDTIGCSKTWLQECTVPVWVRGEKEVVKIVKSKSAGTINIRGVSLGFSGASPAKGVTAEVVEVKSVDEIEKIGKKGIEGKIVFFNRPFDHSEIRTFSGYGGAVDQRVNGPSKAAEYGAVGALVRSMTPNIDEWPHTGVTVFKDGIKAIPAFGIATKDAAMLSELLKKEKINVFLKTNCKVLPDKISHNVIGEIRGSKYPDEFIVVGGHLDSWDTGGGAHDDGAGCVQSMEVLQLLLRSGYKPQRTIRCVLFMNEENGLGGGKAYAEEAKKKGENHLAALESDSGGFTPRGISCEGDEKTFIQRFKKVNDWNDYFEPYDLRITKGGSGADISPLKPTGTFMMGLRPDSQRYFDYHHTAQDRITAVNRRELAMGSATMAAMIYLIDQYGL